MDPVVPVDRQNNERHDRYRDQGRDADGRNEQRERVGLNHQLRGQEPEIQHAGDGEDDGLIGGVGPYQGSLAEYVAVDADLIARKPRQLPMTAAAALPLAVITAGKGIFDRASVAARVTSLWCTAVREVSRVLDRVARALGCIDPVDHPTRIRIGPNMYQIAVCAPLLTVVPVTTPGSVLSPGGREQRPGPSRSDSDHVPIRSWDSACA